MNKEDVLKSLSMYRVFGSALSLSPITHGEIVPEEERNNMTRFRVTPFICTSGNETKAIPVPTITGNPFRGISHRGVSDLTMKTLGLNLGDMAEKGEMSPLDSRLLTHFLRVGGSATKGQSPAGGSAEEYRQLKQGIPTVALYGGVYRGHMFEGLLRMGFLYVLTQETASILVPGINAEEKSLLPELNDLKLTELRFMRKREPGEVPEETVENGVDEEAVEKPEGKKKNEKAKEGSIFGFEVLPVGVRFVQEVILTNASENPGAMLALKAALGLIVANGTVGGNAAKGFGKVIISYKDEKGTPVGTMDDIAAYVDYVIEHKDEMIDTIKSIPKMLGSVPKKKNGETSDKTNETPDKANKKNGKNSGSR